MSRRAGHHSTVKLLTLLKVTLLSNYILEISISLQDIGRELNESGKLDC